MRNLLIGFIGWCHLNRRQRIILEEDGDGVHPHSGRFPSGMRTILIAVVLQSLRLEVTRFAHISDNHLINTRVLFPVGRSNPYKRRPTQLLDNVFYIIRALLNDIAHKKFITPSPTAVCCTPCRASTRFTSTSTPTRRRITSSRHRTACMLVKHLSHQYLG